MNISYGGPHTDVECPLCVDYIGTVEFLSGGTIDLYRHLENENSEGSPDEYSIEWNWVYYPDESLTDENWEELDRVIRMATSIVKRVPMESLFHKSPTGGGEQEDE